VVPFYGWQRHAPEAREHTRRDVLDTDASMSLPPVIDPSDRGRRPRQLEQPCDLAFDRASRAPRRSVGTADECSPGVRAMFGRMRQAGYDPPRADRMRRRCITAKR
jgi:hypothetical protein